VEPFASYRDFSSSVQSGSALAVYENSSTCYTSWLHPALTKNHHGDMWVRSCRYSALHHSTRSRPGDVRQRSNTARDRGARGWASGHKEKVSQAQQPCLHPTSHFFFGWLFREAVQSWLFDGASCKVTDFFTSSPVDGIFSSLGRQLRGLLKIPCDKHHHNISYRRRCVSNSISVDLLAKHRFKLSETTYLLKLLPRQCPKINLFVDTRDQSR